MARVTSKSIYNTGDTVHAISNPELKLVVKRYVDRIYYCLDPKDPTRKELTFFEKEIIATY